MQVAQGAFAVALLVAGGVFVYAQWTNPWPEAIATMIAAKQAVQTCRPDIYALVDGQGMKISTAFKIMGKELGLRIDPTTDVMGFWREMIEEACE